MKKILLTLVLITSYFFSIAQQVGCDNDRYFNTVFENVIKTSDVQYGQNTTVGGKLIDLKMDIYEPEGDKLEKRPLIVFAHGGGFVGGNKDDFDEICRDFTKRGYVTASISYRKNDSINGGMFVWAESMLMAMLDMKAAIRYFREDADTKNIYRIDSENVFIGGASAGGIMANMVGYMEETDNIPEYQVNLINKNGGWEGNSSSNTNYSSSVSGILNYSGAIPDVGAMDADDPPLYSFLDEFDLVTPCGLKSEHPKFLDGCCAMHEKADELSLKNEFYLRSGSYRHCGWDYENLIDESCQFLGEIICGRVPAESDPKEVHTILETPGFTIGDIAAVDDNNIWTIPMFGNQFYRTSDGGKTWNSGYIPLSDSSYQIVSLEAFSKDIAWVMALSMPVQNAGIILKTTDGGLNWVEQTTSFINPNEGPQVFHFFNENDGFALAQVVNSKNRLFSTHAGYITSDGGDTWEKLDTDAYPAAQGEELFVKDNKFLQAKGDHLRFGTSNGKMYHSSDRGRTWNVQDVSPGIAIQSIAFKDDLNGIAVSGNDFLGTDIIKAFSTSDGGQSWTELKMPEYPRTTSIYFIEGSINPTNSCGTYIMYADYGSLSGTAVSNDDGQTWNLVNRKSTGDILFINPNVGWVGGTIPGSRAEGLYEWVDYSFLNNKGCTPEGSN